MFDQDKLDVLVEAEASQAEVVTDLAKRIREVAESDAEVTPAVASNLVKWNHKHELEERKLASIKDDIARMEAVRPAELGPEGPSAMARFAKGGSEGLDEDERAKHVRLDGGSFAGLKDLGIEAVDVQDIGIPGGGRAEFFIERVEPVAAVTRSDQSPGGEDWTQPLVSTTLDIRLAAYGGLMERVSTLTTRTGVEMSFPQFDDTSQKGEWLANQAGTMTQGDLENLRSVKMETAIHTSKAVDISIAMIQDSHVGSIEGLVNRLMDIRHGRGLSEAIVTGAGANGTPRGVLTDAKDGLTAASATAFTSNELLELPDKVDIAYQQAAGEGGVGGMTPTRGTSLGFCMHQQTLGFVRRLNDGEGRPLYLPAVYMGDPGVINASGTTQPVFIDNAMPQIATGNKVIVYGNFSYYLRRQAGWRVVARWFDSAVGMAYKIRFGSFIRAGGRFVGGFSAGNTCEAVATLKMG